MPSRAAIVITPVPPTPVTTMPYAPSSAGSSGSGRTGNGTSPAASAWRSLPPLTVTKLGQKPFRQEKSLLQADWSIRRLRPNSVSCGLDGDAVDWHAAIAAALADQLVDDHPLVRVGKAPRLRRRRFSAAQVWS